MYSSLQGLQFMADASKNTLVCLGVISDAHGTNGEVLIKAYTEYWEDVAAYGALFDENGKELFELKDVRVVKKGVIAKIKGIRYRDQAEALKGQELFVDRSSLPSEDDEETWYHVDLIGLKAVDAEGAVFGEILAIPNFGAGDLVEVRLSDSGKTILVPFTKECVPTIDVAGGVMTVIEPEDDGDDGHGDVDQD